MSKKKILGAISMKTIVTLAFDETVHSDKGEFNISGGGRKYDTPPHQDFRDAYDRFLYHAIRVLFPMFRSLTTVELQENEDAISIMTNAKVASLSLSGNGLSQGLVMKVETSSFDGKKNKLTTSPVRFDKESSSYDFSEQLGNDWKLLEEEAIKYSEHEKFDAEQLSMFKPSDDQTGDTDAVDEGDADGASGDASPITDGEEMFGNEDVVNGSGNPFPWEDEEEELAF